MKFTTSATPQVKRGAQMLLDFNNLKSVDPKIYDAIYSDIRDKNPRWLPLMGIEEYFSSVHVLTKITYIQLIEKGFVE